MSNTDLTNYEMSTLYNLRVYLLNAGCFRLADRLDRVQYHFTNGLLSREEFFNGIVKEAAIRGISIACKNKQCSLISDFADLLDGLE